MVTPKIFAYFIARGFIIEFWRNRVLYFVRVYKCDSNIKDDVLAGVIPSNIVSAAGPPRALS